MKLAVSDTFGKSTSAFSSSVDPICRYTFHPVDEPDHPVSEIFSRLSLTTNIDKLESRQDLGKCKADEPLPLHSSYDAFDSLATDRIYFQPIQSWSKELPMRQQESCSKADLLHRLSIQESDNDDDEALPPSKKLKSPSVECRDAQIQEMQRHERNRLWKLSLKKSLFDKKARS